VFKPLGLEHTRFVLTPDDSTLTHLAVEYRSDGTVRTRRSSRAYPAGNIATTGADMSVFLRWLLTALRAESDGAESRIAKQMIGPMLRYHAAMPPMGYGFNGVPLAGRTVDEGRRRPIAFRLMAIIPSFDIGLFIALNRQEPLLWDRLMPLLARRFWADSARIDSAPGAVRPISGTTAGHVRRLDRQRKSSAWRLRCGHRPRAWARGEWSRVGRRVRTTYARPVRIE
jgi:CubicO group peptidase (beta-lactamase class C family)